MKKQWILFSIGALLLSLLGAIVGLIFGSFLGGNLILEADYAGLVGYESTGLVGAVVFATLFCLVFIGIVWKRKKTTTSTLLACIGCLIGGTILYITVGYLTTNTITYGWTFPFIGTMSMHFLVQALQTNSTEHAK